MKKRIAGIAALAAAMAVALALPLAGTSAAPDVKGPQCAGIFLTANYSGTLGGSATVSGTLQTREAASCPGAVYTVQAVGTTDGADVFIGDGIESVFSYSIDVSSAPASICVFATSQMRSNAAAADVAPDTQCADPTTFVLLNDPNPPAGGFD